MSVLAFTFFYKKMQRSLPMETVPGTQWHSPMHNGFIHENPFGFLLAQMGRFQNENAAYWTLIWGIWRDFCFFSNTFLGENYNFFKGWVLSERLVIPTTNGPMANGLWWPPKKEKTRPFFRNEPWVSGQARALLSETQPDGFWIKLMEFGWSFVYHWILLILLLSIFFIFTRFICGLGFDRWTFCFQGWWNLSIQEGMIETSLTDFGFSYMVSVDERLDMPHNLQLEVMPTRKLPTAIAFGALFLSFFFPGLCRTPLTVSADWQNWMPPTTLLAEWVSRHCWKSFA